MPAGLSFKQDRKGNGAESLICCYYSEVEKELFCERTHRSRKEPEKSHLTVINLPGGEDIVPDLQRRTLKSYFPPKRFRISVPGIKIKSSSNLDDTTEFPEIHAIIGSTVYLPCPLSPPASDDAIALVLWYRLDLANPIYTLDARSVPSEAKHFSSKVLGSRAYFNVSRGAFAHIKLEPVEEDDEGEYRCRIDYKKRQNTESFSKTECYSTCKKFL
ncbi:nephrin [Caerostris extrusa]|uniref:Nephrin n=1 Tax=Caerostris extrusa TaxID=172846 RepID=A0AAV4NJH2_CAEEX|nr:nephrin [Caerostris extrusa]